MYIWGTIGTDRDCVVESTSCEGGMCTTDVHVTSEYDVEAPVCVVRRSEISLGMDWTSTEDVPCSTGWPGGGSIFL